MNKKIYKSILCLSLVFLILFTACGDNGDEQSSAQSESALPQDEHYPVELRGTILQQRPTGVVSISPALSELVRDMGFEETLLGVSDYCDNPNSLPLCGSPQQIDFDAISSTGANLVISSTAPIEQDVVTLQQMNIDIIVLERANSLDELELLYKDLALVLAGNTEGKTVGEEYWTEFSTRLESLADRAEIYADQVQKTPTVIFLRILNYTMATGDTFENELLEYMGFDNLAASYGDWLYPEAESANLTPDLIISNLDITIPILEQNAVYKGTQAVIQDQVVTVDMQAFERQTPRMLDELERVADFLFDGNVNARSPEGEGTSA